MVVRTDPGAYRSTVKYTFLPNRTRGRHCPLTTMLYGGHVKTTNPTIHRWCAKDWIGCSKLKLPYWFPWSERLLGFAGGRLGYVK